MDAFIYIAIGLLGLGFLILYVLSLSYPFERDEDDRLNF
jgi:hypothetical protein